MTKGTIFIQQGRLVLKQFLKQFNLTNLSNFTWYKIATYWLIGKHCHCCGETKYPFLQKVSLITIFYCQISSNRYWLVLELYIVTYVMHYVQGRITRLFAFFDIVYRRLKNTWRHIRLEFWNIIKQFAKYCHFSQTNSLMVWGIFQINMVDMGVCYIRSILTF